MYGQKPGQQFLSNYLLGTSLGLEANRREMRWIDQMFIPYEVSTDAIVGGTIASSGLSTIKIAAQELWTYAKTLFATQETVEAIGENVLPQVIYREGTPARKLNPKTI